ncbi:NRDE family protein [Lysinibacillus telephonicus]|uniref:NRDE family protein n=1 Tax=Lysinibacillus telephonicus TaxID=1714840 RepID=A0A431UWX8_9BACI|nr:NRDE family protein [Lysinibacillus telephonicus]RTQ96059.1 NRDE family protein [Lysinibacillus telephonicus]
MCLINFHFQDHPLYKLIVVANRDESYARPTKRAGFWDDEPNILAGRDLLQMGTWLGVSRQGRFAAITNFRDPSLPERTKSRGEIVRMFLSESRSNKEFIDELKNSRELYGGYNVLVGDGNQLMHYNNILDEINEIQPGTHSLSNYSLNTSWPKVVKGKQRLYEYLQSNPGRIECEELFKIVDDITVANDEDLPDTGVGIELERLLSPIFIKMPNYGTRCSTVVLINKNNEITFVEKTFQEGKYQFETKYEFKIKE